MSQAWLPWVALCWWSAALAADAPAALELRYRFAPGASESWTVSSDEAVEMSTSLFPGVSQRFRQQSRLTLRRRVLALEPTGAVVELSFPEVEATLESGGRPRPLAQQSALSAVRLSLRQSERGEFSEARLLDAEALDPAVRFQAQEFASALARSALVFPERALSPGDTWIDRRAVAFPVPGAPQMLLEMETTYRLVELPTPAQGAALIRAELRAALDEPRGQDGAGPSAKIQVAGTGEFYFRPDTGRLVSSRCELSLSGEFGTRDAGGEIVNRLSLKISSETRVR